MIILGCVIVIVIMVILTEVEKIRMRKEVNVIKDLSRKKDEIFKEVMFNSEELIKDFEMLTEILEDNFTVAEINEMYNTKKINREEENNNE